MMKKTGSQMYGPLSTPAGTPIAGKPHVPPVAANTTLKRSGKLDSPMTKTIR